MTYIKLTRNRQKGNVFNGYLLNHSLEESPINLTSSPSFRDLIAGNNWKLFSPTITLNGIDNVIVYSVTHAATSKWKIHAKFKVNSYIAGMQIFSGGISSREMTVTSANKISIILSSGVTVTSTSTYSTGQWIDVVFEYIYTSPGIYTTSLTVNGSIAAHTVSGTPISLPQITFYRVGQRSGGSYVPVELAFLRTWNNDVAVINSDYCNMTYDGKVYGKVTNTFTAVSGTLTNCNTYSNISNPQCYTDGAYIYALTSDATTSTKNLLVSKYGITSASVITGYTLLKDVEVSPAYLINKHKIESPNVASHKTADTSQVLYTGGVTPKIQMPTELAAISTNYFFVRKRTVNSNTYGVDRLLFYSAAQSGGNLLKINEYILETT